MPELTDHKCPKCGARLAVLRVDHHLGGHEWLACPVHGNIRRLHEKTTRRFHDDREGYEEEDE